MSAVLDKIKAELAAFNEKKKALTEKLRKEFPALFAPLFAESKRIESIGWAQYTPYWNDGDECIFRVRRDEESLYINGESVDDMEDNFLAEDDYTKVGRDWVKQANPAYDQHEDNIFKKMASVLQEIPMDFCKELFGDHAKVTITKSGEISVEDYSHD